MPCLQVPVSAKRSQRQRSGTSEVLRENQRRESEKRKTFVLYLAVSPFHIQAAGLCCTGIEFVNYKVPECGLVSVFNIKLTL